MRCIPEQIGAVSAHRTTENKKLNGAVVVLGILLYLSRLVESNAALHGSGQSLWLLMDLLLHEMVVPALHDMVHL